MRNGRKINRKTTIALLVLLLVGITIGYAYLSANLKIGGNSNIKSNKWDIHFENVKVTDGSVTTDKPATIDSTKQTINYTISLEKPGDFYEFTTSVVNAGTIDGKLGDNTNLIGPELTDAQKKYLNYVVTYENANAINKGDLLKASDSKNVLVRVEYKKDLENADLPKDGTTLNLTFNMEYIQDDGTGKDVDANKKEATAATQITELATTDTTNMVADDGTADHNTRYIGANPNNYVKFNNELWRIVGVFNNIKTTASGEGETRIKIVKNGYYNTRVNFDSNDVNDYSTSSLKTELNGTYLNSLTSEAQRQIDDAVWNLGGWTTSDVTVSAMYGYERGTTIYSGHATTWTGKVGLYYPSDYGYANGEASCRNSTTLYNHDSSTCKTNNYLYDSNYSQWTISPRSDISNFVFSVYPGGYVNYNGYDATFSFAARPAVFLKSKISITSGTGASNDPFILG